MTYNNQTNGDKPKGQNTMNAIFKTECENKNIEFTIVDVKKIDPKSKEIVWEQNVAIPNTVNGFVELMGEDRTHSFLVDKTKIWLRSQNDPRKPDNGYVTIDGEKISKDDIREFLASRR